MHTVAEDDGIPSFRVRAEHRDLGRFGGSPGPQVGAITEAVTFSADKKADHHHSRVPAVNSSAGFVVLAAVPAHIVARRSQADDRLPRFGAELEDRAQLSTADASIPY